MESIRWTGKTPSWYLLKPVNYMWGRLVCQVRAGGEVVCIRVGGTLWNTVKGCGIEKRGGETKILKCGGQAESRGGFFKKEAENPLWTMVK